MMKVLLPAVVVFAALQQDGAAPPKVDFVRDIQPIFKASCLKCHGPEKPKGQFRLDSKPLAMKGGVAGKAILPGKGADSPLVQMLLLADPDERMPRKADALPKAQIDRIRAWIDQGVEWPDSASADARPQQHWAYVKPVRPPLPK